MGIDARIGNECFTSLQGINKGKGFLNNDRERSSIATLIVTNFKERHFQRHDRASRTKVRRIRWNVDHNMFFIKPRETTFPRVKEAPMFYFLPKGSRHSNQTRRLGKASCGLENVPGVEPSRRNCHTKRRYFTRQSLEGLKGLVKKYRGGGGGPEQRGGGSSVFEPLVRGGSCNF